MGGGQGGLLDTKSGLRPGTLQFVTFAYVTTYTHAQKPQPRQLGHMCSRGLCTYCIVLYINAYFCSVVLFSHYYIFGTTWPVTLVSEVDDAMTEDSSVNVNSTKVVRYCARPPTKFTAKTDWEL